jgi:NAD(P)-dependent dehydrogenase (short-subunit alcohol dehydrogenase family)
MSFAGRTAIVTGGTRGLGAAITERLVGEGAHVAAIFNSNEVAASDLIARVAPLPGSVSLHRGDIADRDWCQSVVAEVLAARGRIDHLVNNAGKLIENAARRMTVDEWDDALRVNLTAPFQWTQAALPAMIEQGFGRIVMVSSVTAVMGNNVEAGYGAAKAGLHGLVRSLAREVGRKGITVNCVVPGVFETEMTWNMRPEAQEAIRQMIPVGRRGEPEELAHAVAYLLDDRAGFVTGSIVTVDGGISMGG